MSIAMKVRSIPCVIAVLAVFALLPSCGGSSGGGGGGGDDTVVIPDVFNFTMDLDVDGQDPFNISYASDPVNKVITLRTIDAPLLGTYAYATGDYTLGSDQFDIIINVTNAEWIEPYKTFTMSITTPIAGNIDEEPSDGSVLIDDGPNTIALEIGASEVTLSLNSGGSTSYSWDQLYAMYYDTDRDLLEREASLAATILALIKEELSFSAYSLELIETNDDILDNAGFISFDGDILPITPPLGEGTQTLTAESGGVGPGSNFNWSFDYCWFDDPSSIEDLLYNGTISMLGLLELVEEDGSTETITGLGFVPDVTPGGVYYNGFRVYITEEDAQGNVTIAQDRTLIYNGGYSIMFYTE